LEPPLFLSVDPIATRGPSRRSANSAKLGVAADPGICTGDVVAYCVEPEATAAASRDWGVGSLPAIAGSSSSPEAPTAASDFKAGTERDRFAKSWYEFACLP
jgi:hypothetical protein